MPNVMPMRSFLAIHGCGVVLLYRFSRAASLASWMTPQHVPSRCLLNLVAGGAWTAMWGSWLLNLSKGHNVRRKRVELVQCLWLFINHRASNDIQWKSGTGTVHVIGDATNQNSAKSSFDFCEPSLGPHCTTIQPAGNNSFIKSMKRSIYGTSSYDSCQK